MFDPHRAVAALALLAGCSGPADKPAAPATTTAVSESGALRVVLHASPGNVPVRGNNEVELDVVRIDSEEPVEGLALSMVPFMPAMGHGSSVVARCSEEGAGHYRCEDVVLTMPGLWELRTTMTGTASDGVLFRFDVE